MKIPAITAVLVAICSNAMHAADRPIDGMMDNSFFIEEAYNQEPGVVQHIFTGFYHAHGADERGWDFSFTQEWPVFSQTHQFSYTVPYSFAKSGGHWRDGVGDVLLNYRFQAFFDEKTLRAFAPRVSLVLPTGAEAFSDNTLGYQINLPFSTTIGDRWFVHLNAGSTWLPDAESAGGRDLRHYNLGASAIYALTSDLHLMLEWTGGWKARIETRGHDFEALISPGVRKAFNLRGGTQVVLGVAAPIGITRAAPDFGVFLYASFEHPFVKTK